MTLQERSTRSVGPPEPDVTPEELVRRAAAMRETLRSRQDECEELGRLPESTSQDYVDAGFFRVLQPRRFGGYEFGLDTFLRITAELSRGCPSSGWVYGLMAGHNFVTALFDEQGQVELFGDGDFRCPLSNLPAPAVKVDGGYIVSGGWDYSSGCDVATHFIGGAVIVPTASDEPVDTRWVAMRRDQYEIIDNWNTLGMRGTGSRRVVVENLFIPEHHTVPSPNPTRPVVEFPGRNVHENPIYRAGPIVPLLISEPAAVAVGIAQAAIDEYIEVLTTRHQYGPASPLRADLTVFQRILGQATALVDTAEAALWHVARSWTEQSEHAAATGVHVSDENERRLILIEQQVIELCSQAVELVFRTGGSSAARKGERIERYFRDLNMVRTHVTLQYERTWENVGPAAPRDAPGLVLLDPFGPVGVEESSAMATNDPRTGYAPVNGLEMYYEIHGEGAPLLLLHGAYMTIDLMDAILPGLAASRQVIAVEQQGHGHTADIDRPITYEQMADDSAALLDHLGVGRADVVGYSMGGAIALQMAIRHPAVVAQDGRRLRFVHQRRHARSGVGDVPVDHTRDVRRIADRGGLPPHRTESRGLSRVGRQAQAARHHAVRVAGGRGNRRSHPDRPRRL